MCLLNPESHPRDFQVGEKMDVSLEAVKESDDGKFSVLSSVLPPVSGPLGCSNLCSMAGKDNIESEEMVVGTLEPKESTSVAATGRCWGLKDFASNKAVHSGMQRSLLEEECHATGSDLEVNRRSSFREAVKRHRLSRGQKRGIRSGGLPPEAV